MQFHRKFETSDKLTGPNAKIPILQDRTKIRREGLQTNSRRDYKQTQFWWCTNRNMSSTCDFKRYITDMTSWICSNSIHNCSNFIHNICRANGESKSILRVTDTYWAVIALQFQCLIPDCYVNGRGHLNSICDWVLLHKTAVYSIIQSTSVLQWCWVDAVTNSLPLFEPNHHIRHLKNILEG